ncbi:hypothetical protein V8C35DRAFT_328888 [Trichoderma chlorosporum]
MPILALPQSTVRLLGSSTVINKPCDVVKELLDNAIDAGASFVDVSISSNYLDKIRVRDDGLGIDVEDFDALGRCAHTSKLRAFDELGLRAKETLGFRGEALAAMNTLAIITVTTRTANDVVATLLQLKPVIGGVSSRQPAAAPVGTTVQITKLFEALPARKQYSLKNSAEYIQSTKDLLKAYALARPDLRLSFKVIGEATHSWSYAPVCAAGVKEATMQILGASLANNCIHVSRNSACDQTAPLQLNRQPPEDFILEALIPKPGFNVQDVKGKGLYLSIDSRPISSKDAIAKKITAIYKPYLNQVAGSGEPHASIPNPFIQINIRCPPNAYDANATPLKDEVVFRNDHAITTCFEGLCRRIYAKQLVNDSISTQRPLGDEKVTQVSAKGNSGSGNISSAMHHIPDAHISDSTSNCQPLRTEEQLTAFQSRGNKERPIKRESMSLQLLQDAYPENTTSLARMRMSKTVNMSRTNSNSTDENNTANSVDIQVPLSLMTATIPPCNKRAGGILRIPKMSVAENIERYLLSSKNEDFEIATDETATKYTQPSFVTSTSPKKSPERAPLLSLSESILNAMNDQAESESDTLSAESEAPEPDGNTGSIVVTRQREQIFQRTFPDPMAPSFGLEHLDHSPSFQPRSVAEWPTPPSSGNLRSARRFNSPFSPPLWTLPRDSPTGNTTNAQSRLRAPESGRVIPFTLPGQTPIQQPAALGRTAQHVGLLGHPRSNSGVTQLQLHPQRLHGLSRQGDNEDQDLTQGHELALRQDTRDDVSQSHLSLHGPMQYSPIMQTPSMRTSPLSLTLASNTIQDGLKIGDRVSAAQVPDAIPSIELTGDELPEIAPHCQIKDSTEDSRLYLIKRRRSQARHGRARRISSRLLPFEVMPDHSTMQSASTSLVSSLRKVKLLTRRARMLSDNIGPGSWGHTVKFESMAEVTNLERRLQHAVGAWKQAQRRTDEVEYTLHLAAKGKNMGPGQHPTSTSTDSSTAIWVKFLEENFDEHF